MIGVKSRANRQPFVSSGGLNVGSAEWSPVEKFSVGHAVQGAATCHGQILHRDTLMKIIEQMEKNFFKDVLHSECKVHIALRNLGMRRARRSEQLLHLPGEVRRE